ncbi:MAG: carbohydrate-binding protein, partial [Bacillota bacterium]|nr:carbohydrate-binding protein [Bacillota bacterium]
GSESMTTSSVGWGVTTATKTVTVRDTIKINSSTNSTIDDWLGNIKTNLVQTPGKLEFNLKNTDADNILVFTPYYQKYTGRYGIYFTLIGSRSAFSQNEAENYDTQSGIATESCGEGGQNVANIENGDYVVYNNVNFGSGAINFQGRVSSANSGGNIEIRLDSATGTLIGTCAVSGTGGWQNWVTKSCSVSGVTGTHNLYLKFTGGSGYLFNINWWKFSSNATPTPTSTPTHTSTPTPTLTQTPTPTPEISIDLNHDGAINMADVILIASRFNSVRGDSKYIAAYDLNNDGAINLSDVIIIAGKFNTVV